ncbi:sulfurtransferase complex subunit TusD [Aliikangiella coralliicola]|uniref:Sulfurtransferase complex subunit TusD n=1 Tax=Aliikangiella coralliicola TaxID=2592383 RepID=A0A545UAL0_9GAMM|nr:sulfurtransferase complex subunit TusD [Aliikangiella coralliicola]TQV86498.1 sulfurtransferase complex subunit TusD [Aliikangiella coralliicola]
MSVSFTILVTGSPTNSQAHLSALRFANAVIENNHSISSVFFYQEAVHVANGYIIKPSDEAQLTQKWATLSAEHNVELQVCVAAANRRGVIDANEASLNALEHHSIHPAFSILGLGQFAAKLSEAKTKIVQFK